MNIDLIHVNQRGELESEENLLGAVLLDELSFELAEPFVRNAFKFPQTSAVWSAMRTLRDAGDPVEPGTLLVRLRDDSNVRDPNAYLRHLIETATTSELAEFYARRVQGFHKLRQYRQRAVDLCREVHEADVNSANEIGLRAANAIAAIASEGAGKPSLDLKAHLDRVYADAASERGATGLVTSLHGLHKYVRRFAPGELVLNAGRQSHGKSTVSARVALDAALQGLRVLIFSTEEDPPRYSRRFVAPRAGLTKSQLRDGGLAEEQLARVAAACAELRDLPLIFDPCTRRTIQYIRAQAQRARRDGPLGAIIIDHAQRITVEGHNEGRRLEVGRVARECKDMAVDLECPVFLLSQLARPPKNVRAEHTRPQLHDLRETGELEDEADVVIGIWYRHMCGEGHDWTHGVCELSVLKNRDGRTGGRIACGIDGSLIYDPLQHPEWRGRVQRYMEGR